MNGKFGELQSLEKTTVGNLLPNATPKSRSLAVRKKTVAWLESLDLDPLSLPIIMYRRWGRSRSGRSIEI